MGPFKAPAYNHKSASSLSGPAVIGAGTAAGVGAAGMAASSSIGDVGTSVGSGLRDGLTNLGLNLGTGLGNGVAKGLARVGLGVTHLSISIALLGVCHLVAEWLKSRNRDGGGNKAEEQKGG